MPYEELFIAVIALAYIYHCFCSKKLCGDLMCSSWICLLALNLKTFPGKLYLIVADTEGSTAHPITLIWLETVYCFNCKYFIWITFRMLLPCINIRNPDLHLEKNTFIQYFLRDFICLISLLYLCNSCAFTDVVAQSYCYSVLCCCYWVYTCSIWVLYLLHLFYCKKALISLQVTAVKMNCF